MRFIWVHESVILFLSFRFTYEEFNEAYFANPGRCHTIFCFKDPDWDEYVLLTYGSHCEDRGFTQV